ncbi:MAG TPA: haloacid dehalogenase, partial [Microbacterium sp.]|nr:haloacid dehalogenase [Microbacterium sp.]
PMDAWEYCPHGEIDGCACRKPEPGLILAACAALGVAPDETVVVGDIGSDMGAAQRAGAVGILVPTRETRIEEIAYAPHVAEDLADAVEVVLDAHASRAAGSIR